MHGVTIMCNLWMCPTGMNIINFMLYCNGIMFFHKSVDCTEHSQDADFIYRVSIMLPKCLVIVYANCYLRCVYLVLIGNSQSCCRAWFRIYCVDRN
jgi:hypothetical protein